MTSILRLPALVLALLGSAFLAPLSAQESPPAGVVQDASAAPPSETAVRAFLEEAGPGWRVRRSPDHGFVRFLFGGRAEPSFRPRTDAEYRTVAREHARRAEEITGVETELLTDDRVVFLPLAVAGSTDKVTARFRQAVDGVPVRRGTLNVLMDTAGALLSVDTTALPRLAGFDATPTISAGDALALARELFRSETGVLPTDTGRPRLVVEPEARGKGVSAALGWEIELRFEEAGFRPDGAVYVMAARGAPRRISSRELYHSFDVFGTVRSFVSPGLLPDEPSNPPVSEPLPFVDVVTPLGTFTTDENGDFLIPGANAPLSATLRFTGPFADADDALGSDYELATTLQPNVQNDVVMNPSPTELVTSQANAFRQINLLRTWLVGVNPADTILDFQAEALVNQTSLTCNATFDGFKTNYFVEADGCFNSAFSTIIHHEMGHFLNQLYGNGNGADGFGEGAADVWAMFANDDPVVGADFGGPGTIVRTGENTALFCGDDGQGCHGGVHANGLPLMGAFWKWRENLNATYGDAAGDLAADVLLNAWFNAFDDGQVLSIVEEHLLVLDDDDGDVGNGTPNYADIDQAFREQGWPGFDLVHVEFGTPVLPGDTPDELGPYGVAVDLASATGGFVAAADVRYRVDGGPFQTVPMANVVGDLWTGLVPGQVSPALVELYVSAEDDLGSVQTLPADAPAELFSFRVGVDVVHYADSFDGPTDGGWTHVEVATQDDWQRDVPTGQSGQAFNIDWQDPPAAASPPFCWGNDLGVSGFNGEYQPDVDNSLFSPPIDLSGATDTVLAFQRWLNVERGEFDTAQILVDGNVVWENPFDVHVRDTEWTDFEVDVSAFADGNPSAEIQFRLATDGGLHMGGWTIDDVRILTHAAVQPTCSFTTYGTGLAGVAGVPTLDTGGQQMHAGNLDFHVRLKNGRPISGVLFFAGFAPTSVPLLGGTLLVDPITSFLRPVDAFGQSTLDLPIPAGDPSLIGQDVYLQAFVADDTLPEGFSITPGIQVTVCN